MVQRLKVLSSHRADQFRMNSFGILRRVLTGTYGVVMALGEKSIEYPKGTSTIQYW